MYQLLNRLYHELNDMVEYQLNFYFPRKFTIEITESCNLRCKYCFFAREDKVTRKHSFRNMDIETAKKAIDFYFNLYTSLLMKIPTNKRDKLISLCPPKMSWWGGEPLLAFDVIKESKQYFDSLNWDKFNIQRNKLAYIIVSNLTIINKDIADFLVKNNVLLHVSIDGGRKEHDANRVFAGGKGTFNTVLQNLMYLIEKYPEYAKTKIVAQSVAADNINIKNSYNFMKEQFKIDSRERLILRYIVYNQKKERRLFSESQIKMQNETRELTILNKILKILSEMQEEDFREYLTNNHDVSKEFENLLLLERKLAFEKIKNSDVFLRKEEQHSLLGGKSCNDNAYTCTGGGLPPLPAPTPPKPMPTPQPAPMPCDCNCGACWGQEASWFALGMNFAKI
jgi:uncharacterized protein